MSDIKISLVIPAYNEEKYIGECLRAAKASGQFYEIIVVDNASTDKTREECEKIDGVKVVRENNKGITWARQCGYKAATGDVLAYVDADTRMPSEWFSAVQYAFTENTSLAVLSGPYIYYDDTPVNQLIVKYLWWYIFAFPLYWWVGYMTVGGNFAIKKDVLDRMGGFDTAVQFYGEDTNIARRASEHGSVKFSPTLIMYTSNRRMKGQGILKTGWLYAINFLSEVYRKKPVTMEYIDIR